MTEKTRAFLKRYLPETLNAVHPNDILDPLYDLIDYQGFDDNYDYNDFGVEAQEVYDDIYYSNRKKKE
jgi:hypothetical protein